jgi:hypothetical protein
VTELSASHRLSVAPWALVVLVLVLWGGDPHPCLRQGHRGPVGRTTLRRGPQRASARRRRPPPGSNRAPGGSAVPGSGRIGLDEDAGGSPSIIASVPPPVSAVGDVTGVGACAHVAYYQAVIAVAAILGQWHPPADYLALPRVTYTDPEVGSVGLIEAQAAQAPHPGRTGAAA